MLAPLAIVLGILPMATAFSSSFTGFNQCQSSVLAFNNVSSSTATSPISFLVAPVNATISSSLTLTIPDPRHQATNLPLFPLAAGTHYVSVLSDASGFGSGGVSRVLTVGDSDQSSCLTGTPTPSQIFTTSSTSPPLQCQPFTIHWDPSNSRLGSDIAVSAIVLGGPVVTVGSARPSAAALNWTVNLSQGTQFMLIFSTTPSSSSGGQEAFLETSLIFTVGGNSGGETTCLGAEAPTATMSIPPASATPLRSSRNSNIPLIAGLVIGLSAAILLPLLLWWLFRRRRITARQQHQRPPSVEPAFIGGRPRSTATVPDRKSFYHSRPTTNRQLSHAASTSRHTSPIPTPDLDLSVLANVEASDQFTAPSGSHPPSPALSRDGSSNPSTQATRKKTRRSLLFSPNPIATPPSLPP